jgi:hypothetical protein
VNQLSRRKSPRDGHDSLRLLAADWNARSTRTKQGGQANLRLISTFSLVYSIPVIALYLFVQRRYYVARRRKHLRDPIRTEAGLPIGRSMRSR